MQQDRIHRNSGEFRYGDKVAEAAKAFGDDARIQTHRNSGEFRYGDKVAEAAKAFGDETRIQTHRNSGEFRYDEVTEAAKAFGEVAAKCKATASDVIRKQS